MITRQRIQAGCETAWENLIDLANQRDDLKVALAACERLLTRSMGTEDAWSKQLELDLEPKDSDDLESIERKIIELKQRSTGKDGE